MTDARFQPFGEKLRKDRAPDTLVATFQRQFVAFAGGHTGMIPVGGLGEISSLPAWEDLKADGSRHLASTILIKLNGGLGTGMGLDQAKSLLPVKRGLSFLDILAEQTLSLRRKHGVALPLVLMNSFSTESDTRAALARHAGLDQQPVPQSFLQHRVPRIRADNLLPVEWPADPEKEWCPPGHGDLYIALRTSGLLEQLLDAGFEYAFVSNSDNLGATLDTKILGYFAERRLPFMMEVTDRTAADSKGGHLARRKGGGYLLREIAQCPENELQDFQDVRRHRFFNTNNLWLNLKALDGKRDMDLPIIVNRKTVDPRDPKSPAVIQIETAMGSALAVFDGAEPLRVPRTRFSPVKTTNDLLALWSDAFVMSDEWHLKLDPSRKTPPVIRLDPEFYRKMDGFQARFPNGAPSLIHCESLDVEGDCYFARDVIVKGRASVRNTAGTPLKIADGSIVGD